jgi:hypothetical protein
MATGRGYKNSRTNKAVVFVKVRDDTSVVNSKAGASWFGNVGRKNNSGMQDRLMNRSNPHSLTDNVHDQVDSMPKSWASSIYASVTRPLRFVGAMRASSQFLGFTPQQKWYQAQKFIKKADRGVLKTNGRQVTRLSDFPLSPNENGVFISTSWARDAVVFALQDVEVSDVWKQLFRAIGDRLQEKTPGDIVAWQQVIYTQASNSVAEIEKLLNQTRQAQIEASTAKTYCCYQAHVALVCTLQAFEFELARSCTNEELYHFGILEARKDVLTNIW